MDQIIIQDLNVYAKHGVYAEENILGQQFLISITMDADLSEAGQSDDLESTIDYGSLCHFVTKYMHRHTYKLIESVAEHLAEEILLQYDRIRKIKVKVKKPWAPIGLPIKTISIVVERTRHVAYIGLGSNMGDRRAYIDQAVKELDALDSCKVRRISQIRETEPYGNTQQDKFLNGVLCLETVLKPERLLQELLEIEAHAGRTRDVHWGPRTLDLDLLLYDNDVIRRPELTVPHQDMQNRKFVLEPLCELAPSYRHPALHKTIRQLYEELMG